jgi:hypothetical protein
MAMAMTSADICISRRGKAHQNKSCHIHFCDREKATTSRRSGIILQILVVGQFLLLVLELKNSRPRQATSLNVRNPGFGSTDVDPTHFTLRWDQR